MKLLITSTAEQDLRNIGDFIAQDNPARAVTFVRELQEQCQRLLVFPEAYRARPELGKNMRSMPHQQYVVFYQVDVSAVRIIRILNGAMDAFAHVKS